MKLIKLILICALLTGCSTQKNNTIESTNYASDILTKDDFTIAVSSDIHYLNPSLIKQGKRLERLINNGDGKIMQYSDEIISAFIEQVIDIKPDILLLTGDLALDGQKDSHLLLAKKLSAVEKNGTRVFVTPGNHDINIRGAFGIGKEKAYSVDSVTVEEFEEIYQNYGYLEAISRDTDSLSYIAKINENTWLSVLDTNKYKQYLEKGYDIPSGELSDETYNWLEEQLKKAKENNITVISASHHNLLDQSNIINENYTIDNNKRLLDLYYQYNVQLNFSGHVHIQHISSDTRNNQTIYDISSSSLLVPDNHFGILKYSNQQYDYSNQEVNVEEYALKHKLKNKELLNFETYSNDYFYELSYWTMAYRLMEQSLPEEDIIIMSDVLGKLNPAYFSGKVNTMKNELLNSDSYKLYNEKAKAMEYIDDILLTGESIHDSITIKKAN